MAPRCSLPDENVWEPDAARRSDRVRYERVGEVEENWHRSSREVKPGSWDFGTSECIKNMLKITVHSMSHELKMFQHSKCFSYNLKNGLMSTFSTRNIDRYTLHKLHE